MRCLGAMKSECIYIASENGAADMPFFEYMHSFFSEKHLHEAKGIFLPSISK
jgi:hypothetical protein